MKKIFTVLILCNIVAAGYSQTIEKTVVAGGLSTSFTEEEKKCISLKVNGTLNVADFVFMRDNLPNLEILDLLNVNITAYNGVYTPNENGYFVSSYSANEIPGYSFSNWYSGTGKGTLKTVKLPVSIISIGINAFSACIGLTEVEFPSSLNVIHSLAFQGCTALTVINFPEGLTDTGDNVFSRCYSLTSVHLPNSLIYLGNGIFSECTNLKAITIPENVIRIGLGAFSNCIKLADIYANPTVPVDLSSSNNIFLNVDKTTCALHVPEASYSAYRNALEWKDFKNINNQIVTSINNCTKNDFKILNKNRQIEIQTDKCIKQTVIFDLSGKSIFASQNGEKIISTSEFKPGIYIIEIQSDNKKFSFKIMK